MKHKCLPVVAVVLKMLMGVLFLISALAKLNAIDIFETYVYSFGLFSMTTSFFLSRIVIGLELVLGVALISNRHHRFTMLMTLLYLLCFIVFLTYAHLIGRSDSCHCFGELLPFDPVQSIVKNAVLVLVLLFSFKYTPAEWSPRWWLVIIVYLLLAALMLAYYYFHLKVIFIFSFVMLAVCMAVSLLASFKFYRKWYVTAMLIAAPIVSVFILSPPDNWMFSEGGGTYDSELLVKQLSAPAEETMLAEPDSLSLDEGALAHLGFDSGRRLVALFSPTCDYCTLAAQKICTIVERHQIDSADVAYVFPVVKNKDNYNLFFEKSMSPRYNFTLIDKTLFVKITRGSFPVVVLLEDGVVRHAFEYRNIDEAVIASFMNNKPNNTEK